MATGCFTCINQQQQFSMCLQTTTIAPSGACHSYSGPYQSACSDDTSVLSVICGNGSGDGG